MSRYVVPKRMKKYNTKVSRSYSESEGSLFDTVKRLFILGTACLLAGLVALKLYLAIIPPIANLSDFKTFIITLAMTCVVLLVL